ncbi:MAG TPA: zinc ribbon domain-containing protein [Candidatus Paceibacterota bacterium]|nr:zinc ribbon domain-containing protein [Candidatus Paceibacterota bacterium]
MNKMTFTRPSVATSMRCPSCGNDNKRDSRFCRHCGKSFGDVRSQSSDFTFFELFKKIRARYYAIFFVCLLFLAGVAYAGVKADDYIKVNAAMARAQQLNQNGSYQDALTALVSVQSDAVFASQKNKLSTDIQNENEFIKDKDSLLAASSSIASGDLQTAQNLLESISSDFPQYKIVSSDLTEIVEQYSAQASSSQAAAAAAKAAASKASQAQAAAQQQASAAQQQASAAKLEATTEAANAAHQALLSFYNQLQTIYSSYINGMYYYNEGIDDYNAAEYSTAIVAFGQANAVFSKAYSDAYALPSNFTNLPDDYVQAGEDMATAASDMDTATKDMIDNSDSYYTVSVSPYTTEAYTNSSSANSWLQTTSP